MKGAVPMNIMRISFGCTFSDRGSQLAALFNHGCGLIPSNNRPSFHLSPGTPPNSAALMSSSLDGFCFGGACAVAPVASIANDKKPAICEAKREDTFIEMPSQDLLTNSSLTAPPHGGRGVPRGTKDSCTRMTECQQKRPRRREFRRHAYSETTSACEPRAQVRSADYCSALHQVNDLRYRCVTHCVDVPDVGRRFTPKADRPSVLRTIRNVSDPSSAILRATVVVWRQQAHGISG